MKGDDGLLLLGDKRVVYITVPQWLEYDGNVNVDPLLLTYSALILGARTEGYNNPHAFTEPNNWSRADPFLGNVSNSFCNAQTPSSTQ